MRIKETKLYQFDELNERAKEKARDWFRQALCDDTYFSESVIADAADRAAEMGFNIRTHAVKLMNGSTRYDPSVFYSGFSSQGDGACFEGTWNAADVKADKLKESAPQDKDLHRIVDEFAKVAATYPNAFFSVKHSGHYYHELCTQFDCNPGEFSGSIAVDVDCEECDGSGVSTDRSRPYECATCLDATVARWTTDFPENTLIETAREFMRWIYSALETEWEYQNANEQVDENIRANEYEFTEEGERE